MDIAADALLIYAQRYAEKLEQLAQEERMWIGKQSFTYGCHLPQSTCSCARNLLGGTSALLVHTRGITYETNPWDSFNRAAGSALKALL